jgi:ATP/maltotriose-dependent transcriptional regulator MalT
VLDDVDQLEDEDSATQFRSTLCLRAPSRLHSALSGRRLPALGLGSARGRGEPIELNATDPAFTLDETAALLAERLGADAQPVAEQCWSLTAGWAAALQLIVGRLERLAPDRWRQMLDQLRLRRGSVWREFAAELVDREHPSAQRILAIASVTPMVDASLYNGTISGSSMSGSYQTPTGGGSWSANKA